MPYVVSAVDLARRLGIRATTMRAWLRAESAADHPVLSTHVLGEAWRFSPEEADRLEADWRLAHGRARAPGQASLGFPRPSGRETSGLAAVGRRLDAAFEVQVVDGAVTLVIESRSGALGSDRARNPDYNEALALLLARLGQRGASLVDAVVDSTAARRSHPDPATRRLALAYPVDLAVADSSALRLELRRTASAAARRPGASGTGSGEKRLRLFLDLPDDDAGGLQSALSRDSPVLPPHVLPRLRPSARPNAGHAQPRGQGRTADAAFRRAVELRAMSLAVKHFQTTGWSVEDTSADHPYDLRCTRNHQDRHVEVKGTTGAGQQINLTAGEVRHHRQDPLRAVLFVAHSIVVTYDSNGPHADGGRVNLIAPWDVDEGQLEPTAFTWRPAVDP